MVEPAERGVEGARPWRLRDDALNVPNALTVLRILLIPVVLWLLAAGTPSANFWAAMVYIVSTITDFLDGWLARRLGLTSLVGKFLDPLADKLLVMATLIFLAYLGRLPLLGVVAVILIIGRELSVTALRTIAMGEGVVMAAGRGGKDKTALQMSSILLLILWHRYELDFFFFTLPVDLGVVGLVLLYLSLFFTLTSAGEYVRLFAEAVERKDREARAKDAGG